MRSIARGGSFHWGGLLAMLVLTGCATRHSSLKEAADGRFKIGVGTDHGVMGRPNDAALMTKQFNYLTPENCMKMKFTQRNEGEFTFENADTFIDYAERHGMGVVGHCLLWANVDMTPEWFFKDGEEEAAPELVLERLRTHIHAVAGRYKGRLGMWDVVNESLSDSEEEYLRDTEWSRMFGEEYIAKAFQYAREAAPDALLIYNDYRCDQTNKLEKLVRLVKSVRARGGPIDAVGLQAHYEFDSIPFDGIEQVLIEMRELGVKVVFSELDMDVVTRTRWYIEDGIHREELKSFNPYPDGCPPEVLAKQAEQYARLFNIIARHDDVVERVTFWNLHDGQSWLNSFPWKRQNHPMLFDRDGQPKPAYDEVVEVLGMSDRKLRKQAKVYARSDAAARAERQQLEKIEEMSAETEGD